MPVNRLFVFVLTAALSVTAAAQSPSAYKGPRTADGKPDLNGIWQSMTTANWDIQAHSPAPGRVLALGAEDAEPAGLGVVDGGPLPYLPSALATRKANYEKR